MLRVVNSPCPVGAWYEARMCWLRSPCAYPFPLSRSVRSQWRAVSIRVSGFATRATASSHVRGVAVPCGDARLTCLFLLQPLEMLRCPRHRVPNRAAGFGSCVITSACVVPAWLSSSSSGGGTGAVLSVTQERSVLRLLARRRR